MKIQDLSLLTPEKKVELILLQAEENNLLKEEVKKLKDSLQRLQNKNSKNSHKPPSSDQNKSKRTRSLSKKSGKSQGGQPGHKGHNLAKVSNPDQTITNSVDICGGCGKQLNKRADLVESRQVFEIPEPRFIVTEYNVETKICRCCHNVNAGEFPLGVTKATQYGDKARGLMVYLYQGQHLSYIRIKELFKEIYKQNISTGTLVNAINANADKLKTIENNIKSLLTGGELLHVDESGLNISGDKHWLHVASNKQLTHYGVHKQRGFRAMENIKVLPDFQGTMVHDTWKSYLKYTKPNHALCNVHYLCELKYVHEVQELKWAGKMSDLLLRMYIRRQQAIDAGLTYLPKQNITKYINTYNSIIEQGLLEQSVRGTLDSKNLLKRLKKYQKEVLLFVYDFNVPFSNNQAEQDIRMIKIKQKISGGFRTIQGAEAFCVTRSIISTAIKNGKNVLDILQKSFQQTLSIETLLDSS